MKFDELTKSLRRLKVETGSLACLGCGHEHSCNVRGCAIIRSAQEVIEQQQKALESLRQVNSGPQYNLQQLAERRGEHEPKTVD